MQVSLKWMSRAALGVLVVAALAGCAATGVSSQDIAQRIQTAQTPADHQYLANYYTQEAATAKKSADLHRKMGKAYAFGSMGNRGGASMESHCNALVQSYDKAANDYEGMAATHKQMADMTKP
jgi:hypothetical protein